MPQIGSAPALPTIQAVNRDELCSRRLAKTLDALDSSETVIKSLNAVIENQKQLSAAQDAIIKKKDEIIASQAELLKVYDSRKGVKISFLFGLISYRKR